ncbi:CGGC domain-containing protein [Enterococcus sp. LJL99]
MKLGIIRCNQTQDFCPGTRCFKIVADKLDGFDDITEEIELIGFTTCGGCPGKKAILRAKELVKRGADTIAFASCIQKGTPIGYPCPFGSKMKKLLQNNLPETIEIRNYTHN